MATEQSQLHKSSLIMMPTVISDVHYQSHDVPTTHPSNCHANQQPQPLFKCNPALRACHQQLSIGKPYQPATTPTSHTYCNQPCKHLLEVATPLVPLGTNRIQHPFLLSPLLYHKPFMF